MPVSPPPLTGSAPAHPPPERRTLALLQALRALAAISVVIFHCYSEALGWLAPGAPRPPEPFPWMVGVDVFFVISGFIIVLSSRRLFAAPHGVRTFVIRRLIRVLPLYWLMTTLFLCVAFAAPRMLNSPPPDWPQILASYLFLPLARADGQVTPVYSIGWTLNYEMFFYALFALAIAFPLRRGVGAVALFLFAGVAISAWAGPLPQPWGFWLRPVVLDFVFGLALGFLYARGASLPAALAWPGAVLAVALLALDLPAHEPLNSMPTLGPILGYGAVATLLVAMAAFGETQRLSALAARRPDFLRHPGAAVTRVLAELGDASYALYLLHPFVIRPMRQLFAALGFEAWMTPALFAFPGVLASCLAGWLMFRFIEAPATRRLRSWAGV